MPTSRRPASQRPRSAGGKKTAKRATPMRKILPAPRVGSVSREEVSRAVDKVIAARCGSERRDMVQVKNPKTNRYIKIDRAAAAIVAHKRSEGPYKGVPIA